MRNTATKIPDAAYVHQSTDDTDRRYPIAPLQNSNQWEGVVEIQKHSLQRHHNANGADSNHGKEAVTKHRSHAVGIDAFFRHEV
jgi:hypothetical protein